MNDWFKVDPVINHVIHLDAYLTEVDIKEVVEQLIGDNSWEEVTKNVQKACYKHRYKLDHVPEWANIQSKGW